MYLEDEILQMRWIWITIVYMALYDFQACDIICDDIYIPQKQSWSFRSRRSVFSDKLSDKMWKLK